MSIYVGSSKISGVYVGSKLASKVYVGSNLVWQARTEPEVYDFGASSSTQYLTVPEWASRISVVLAAGGTGGQAGSGAIASNGSGGNSGGIEYSVDYSVTPGDQVSIKVGSGGAGGSSSNATGSTGESTSVTCPGSFGTLSASGRPGTLEGQEGQTYGWSSLAENVYKSLCLDKSNPYNTNSANRSLYTGPASSETNGGNGSFGSGGNGGNGGVFGRFTKGGKGGDGFARIVFWP